DGGAGDDTLLLDDSLDGTGRAFTFNAGGIFFPAPGVSINYTDVESVTATMGAGSDVLTVPATNARVTSALNANAGADTVTAGDGDDQVDTRDAVADTTNCGAGLDDVVTDPSDVLAGCETTDRAGPPPTTTTTVTTTAPAPPPPARTVTVAAPPPPTADTRAP